MALAPPAPFVKPTLAQYREMHKAAIERDIREISWQFPTIKDSEVRRTYMQILERMFTGATITEFLHFFIKPECEKKLDEMLRRPPSNEPLHDKPAA